MTLRIFLAAASLAALLIVPACKKDDDNDEGPACTLANADDLTYTTHLKPVIDQYCTGCHNGSGLGPGDYTTYEGLKPNLDNGKVLELVVVDKTMPQGLPMPQAARDSVNCWIKNGYPK